MAVATGLPDRMTDGTYTTIVEIAALEKINESYVGRVLRLTLLALDSSSRVWVGGTRRICSSRTFCGGFQSGGRTVNRHVSVRFPACHRAAAIYTLPARLPDHPAKRIADLLPWNWRP
jgi:hypothetical protein